MKVVIKAAAVTALFAVGAAQANPDVTSREYKLMLKPAQFTYNTEASNADSYLDAAEAAIEAAISRSVTGSDSLTKVRDVKFYDVAGTCELDARGYSFRNRITSGVSEITLKYRGPDRYISDFEDLSATSSSAESKLEEDIGASLDSSFIANYGHSTDASNTRTIDKMDDINTQFPGFDDAYGLSDNLTLSLVGGLNIRERVYEGRVIDLGEFDAEISLTLWYNGAPSGSQHPIAAEVSFKYEDGSADYTQKVVQRAKQSFEALQGLSTWTDLGLSSKTRFVYEYNPTFCN